MQGQLAQRDPRDPLGQLAMLDHKAQPELLEQSEQPAQQERAPLEQRGLVLRAPLGQLDLRDHKVIQEEQQVQLDPKARRATQEVQQARQGSLGQRAPRESTF